MNELLGILPTLNKDYILSQVSEEQIFEYYLQIKVELGVLLKSPPTIRTGDDDPTFSFKYSDNGKLRARDWAGYFWGDCFDAVAYVLRINSKDKKSFSVILDRIARDFKLHKYSDTYLASTGSTIDARDVSTKIKHRTTIQFQPRNWNKLDADFWLKGNIGSKMLGVGRVFPCQYVWINSNLVYTYVPKDPAYAYFFNQDNIKVYFPFRDKFRFLSNTSYLQGIDLLETDRIGVITKSYKDVLSMKSFSLQAVAPSSETVPITPAQWFKLQCTCDHWFSLMDFDRTGILMARKLRTLYGIQPLFFNGYKPLNKRLDSGESGAFTGLKLAQSYRGYPTVKDFYNYVDIYGKEKTFQLINETTNLYQNRFDSYDKEMYDNLNWINHKHKTTHYAPF